MMRSAGKTVEYQFCSSTMIQSTVASDTVSTNTSKPGPQKARMRRVSAGSAVWSCRADQRLSSVAAVIQKPK